MIVSVTNSNENEWAKLCNALWPHHTIEHFLNERANSSYRNEYLYIINDEAAAFMSLSVRNDYVEGTKSSPVGYLEGIYVKPDYRKQGIARKMVEFAKKWSAERGCREFASDCLLENDISRKVHNSIGFKEANIIVCFTMDIS